MPRTSTTSCCCAAATTASYEDGWRLVDDGGTLRFLDPHGHQLPAGPTQPRGDPRAVRHPRITPGSIRCNWGGERLELSLAIEGLLSAERRYQPKEE